MGGILSIPLLSFEIWLRSLLFFCLVSRIHSGFNTFLYLVLAKERLHWNSWGEKRALLKGKLVVLFSHLFVGFIMLCFII